METTAGSPTKWHHFGLPGKSIIFPVIIFLHCMCVSAESVLLDGRHMRLFEDDKSLSN